jgi:hypothetical protein
MTMKENNRKKYGLLSTKIAESEFVFLGHGLCGCCGSIYNKGTIIPSKTHTLLALTMIDPATG